MLVRARELADDPLILPQIHFTPDEYYGYVGAKILDFGNPLTGELDMLRILQGSLKLPPSFQHSRGTPGSQRKNI